jgi:hypothetical protein
MIAPKKRICKHQDSDASSRYGLLCKPKSAEKPDVNAQYKNIFFTRKPLAISSETHPGIYNVKVRSFGILTSNNFIHIQRRERMRYVVYVQYNKFVSCI